MASISPGLTSTQMMNAPFAQAVPNSARVQTQAVSHLLVQYEDRADQETFPGKTNSIRKKSGHYNVTDTSLVSPQYRWPNEGNTTLRNILTQVSMKMRDAVSLP